MNKIITIIIAVLLFNSNAFAYNQNIDNLPKQIHLGTITMPVTTANKKAHEHFLLGVKFLHAFMYQMAIDQFRQAQQLDPGFAMSYWGEAMAYKHPIWSYEDVTAAQAVLKRYEQNKDNRHLTTKETKYLQAVKLYFSSQPLQERDQAYANFMRQFYAEHQDDADVGAFYLLSLLGLAADAGNDPAKNALVDQGRNLITELYQRFPQHPGVVHYFIHYHDVLDKQVAVKAVPAAHTALSVMSSSSHIAHMAAHIFRRLEKWDAFIDANLQSVNAANQMCKLLYGKVDYACNADNKYHSLEWLQYGYLMQHQYDKAATVLKQMHAVYEQDQSLPFKEWYYRMWARQVMATKNWLAAPVVIDPVTVNDGEKYWAAYTECAGLLANGLVNLHQHKNINPQIYRFDEIIMLTNTISEPYIGQTCRLSMYELLRTRAMLANDQPLVARYQHKMDNILKVRKSTGLTPSLSYLHGQV